MNFQQVEETVEQYDPQGSVVRSQQKQEERQPKVDRIAVGGIPGPRSTPSSNPANPAAVTPPSAQTDQAAAPPPAPAGENPLLKQSETVNYEVSKAVRHVVNPVGKVDRVSVAVIVDNHTRITTGQDGKQQATQEPRTADEMKKYKELVSAAIGINSERGDQLTVENISFEGETELVEKPTFLEKQGPVIITGLRYLIVPIVFIILYLLFLRPIQKSVLTNWSPAGAVGAGTRALPRLPGALQTPMTVKQLEAQLNGTPAQQAADAVLEEFAPVVSPSKIEMIRKRVVEHAQADPETVAKLVRVWLTDERNK
jgi:flagellar M-ring protein FliF